MCSTTISTDALDTATINLESLTHLRNECIVTDYDPLAWGVESLIEHGQPLTPAQAGILWFGITAQTVAFLRKHPELIEGDF